MRFVHLDKKSAKPASKKTTTECIPDKYARWKKQLAAWMGKSYNRLPLKSKIITLLCFIALTGGYSIFLIAAAFKVKGPLDQSITHISIPRHVKTPIQNPTPNDVAHSKEYRRIHGFRMYMDSLYKDPGGRLLYDSIIRSHPGLMDSVYRFDHNFSGQGDYNR